jgi:hypothetical protein
MLPAITIRGRVVDASGKPIPAATGHAMIQLERMGVTVTGEVTTGKDGLYEVKTVPADNVYDITMTAKGYGEVRTTVDVGDNQNGVCTAPDITLAVADKSVAGIVVDKDGKAVANAYVSANGDGQKHNQVFTDKDGKFTIDALVEGQVNVNAGLQGGNAYGYVTARAGNQDLKIVLRDQGTSEEVAQPQEPAPLVGKPLPDLKALGSGTAWIAATDQAKDKVILVLWYDSAQRPSRHALSALTEKLPMLRKKNAAVFVVDISGQKPDDAATSQPDPAFPTTWVTEKTEDTRAAWGVKALPWLILTDKEHVVRAEGFSVDELDAKVAEVLAQ